MSGAIELGVARAGERVLLLGGYGCGNAGDEAMLAGFRHLVGGESLTVVSRRPAATERLHGVRAVGLARLPIELLRSDTLVIGGGALFGRDMGPLARLLPLVGLGARALGRRVVLAGINIDDGTPRYLRPWLGLLGRASDAVIVRDHASVDAFAGIGVEARFEPDFSRYVEPASPDVARSILTAAGADPGRPIVGFALTAVDPVLAAAVEQAMPAWLDAIPSAQAVFVATSRHPSVAGHDDLVLGRRLASANPALRLVEGPLAPAEARALFAELDAVVAMRYHANLFARQAGTPLVSLPYAPKVWAWCDDEGIAPASVATVGPALAAIMEVAG